MKAFEKKLLKGGSLAATHIITSEDDQWVRKESCLDTEREYGFQRWYSQLKRLQRYEVLFPDAFVRVRKFGIEGGMGFFDLDYYPTAVNCFDYLKSCTSKESAQDLLALIVQSIKPVHDLKFSSSCSALSLFFEEEVARKLEDAKKYAEFNSFYSSASVNFLGVDYPSLSTTIEKYKLVGEYLYNMSDDCSESYTHGNLTLENILYLPDAHKVVFIDPYEENIIDSPYQDYSQLLQSSNSHYELHNEQEDGSPSPLIPDGLKFFNSSLNSYLLSYFNPVEVQLIRFFEAAQFIRMLPFKMKSSPQKAFFFYSLASKLVFEFVSDHE